MVGRAGKAGAVCSARRVVRGQSVTTVRAVGSKADDMSFRQAGVLQGGNVDVRRKIAIP